MNNKVEILRAICYIKEDLDTISNLKDEFTAKEVEFIVEFKKIYELGLNQLESFINKLDSEGKDLDVYSIRYYVKLLINGPLGQFTKTLSQGKNYFLNLPDVLGILGNKLKSYQNTTILEGYDVPLGCDVNTYDKLPPFLQTNLTNSVKQTEAVFRSSLHSSTQHDNTLPIMDKNPQGRNNDEPSGKWQKKSNGNYCIKDVPFYNILDKINEDIFTIIKNYLGDENFRVYSEFKAYNPFDDKKNEATSKNWEVNKIIEEDGKKNDFVFDLFGKQFDSEERRKSTLVVKNPNKDKKYLLNTVEGQLGN